MPEIYKIATLKINDMATPPRGAMREDFLQKQEIDIILLQDVTWPVFDVITGGGSGDPGTTQCFD